MEKELTSEAWLAEYIASLSAPQRAGIGIGVWRYQVKKGSDEWIIERKARYWNPLLWLALLMIVVIVLVTCVVCWPWYTVETICKFCHKVLKKEVVGCMAVENIQTRKEETE